ncbi:MAG: alpha/beta hydrolase [Actinomycetota bacterium]|nr:alpha/beta hydrolase [Actinomycetota bacterium]
MRLHTREWGSGDQVALLMHGITGSSADWEQVGPALAERGYRAVALDFRGHGESPRASSYEPAEFAQDVLETVAAGPALAIGHSLGGWVLALVVDRLQPALAVYEDPAWDVTTEEQVEIAAELRSQPPPPGFDPAALGGLLPGRGYDDSPPAARVPSLVLVADPSDRISPEEVVDLRRRGFTVETVPGASHWIHAEDLPAFLAALDRWVAAAGGHPTPGPTQPTGS